ncbi:MAG TPA: M13 family metallopeptidase N-terminal domain-containing protein, partial [Vicinamibacteria bacterium]|nr:M13 family metallopeptidase N-terminal domain-containing protein [Vicinamibacteria bacterium]
MNIFGRRIAFGATLMLCTLSGLPALQAEPKASPGTSASGLDLAGVDHAVAPGDDFFLYANGAWLKTTQIPPDRAANGPSQVAADITNQRTAQLIQQAASSSAPAGSVSRKIGDYYTSFMDEAGIEEKGLRPLQPTLDRIAAIADRPQLARYLGSTLRADVDALNATNFITPNLFGVWIAQDLDDPTRYVPFVMQGGLDMPERTYYLDPSKAMAEVRTKYQAHIAKILDLAHVTDASARAGRIFELERRIAETHGLREDSEDVRKSNNHWSRADFDAKAPGLDWGAYFGAA